MRRALRVDRAALCQALAEPDWFGQRLDGPPDRPEIRRLQADLALGLGSDGRVLTFRKAALVDVGPVHAQRDGCTVEIGWQAASFAPLFPVFVGTLSIRGNTLRLAGTYAPPGGSIGLLIDRAFLHHFAFRTAAWFLDGLNARAEWIVAQSADGETASASRPG